MNSDESVCIFVRMLHVLFYSSPENNILFAIGLSARKLLTFFDSLPELFHPNVTKGIFMPRRFKFIIIK